MNNIMAPNPFETVRMVMVLKAVADPTRLRLLRALSQGERSVGQLAELVGSPWAAVSQHLARLRAVGLVASRRDGTRMFYRTADGHVPALLEEAALAGRWAPAAQDRNAGHLVRRDVCTDTGH